MGIRRSREFVVESQQPISLDLSSLVHWSMHDNWQFFISRDVSDFLVRNPVNVKRTSKRTTDEPIYSICWIGRRLLFFTFECWREMLKHISNKHLEEKKLKTFPLNRMKVCVIDEHAFTGCSLTRPSMPWHAHLTNKVSGNGQTNPDGTIGSSDHRIALMWPPVTPV